MKYKDLEKQAKADELNLKKETAKKKIRKAFRLIERTKLLLKNTEDESNTKELKDSLEKQEADYKEMLKLSVEDTEILVADKR